MSLVLIRKTSAVGVQAGWAPLISANLFYSSADQVTVHFVNRDGERFTAIAKEGESLLEVVVNQNLAIDGFGRCCTRVCALRIYVPVL